MYRNITNCMIDKYKRRNRVKDKKYAQFFTNSNENIKIPSYFDIFLTLLKFKVVSIYQKISGEQFIHKLIQEINRKNRKDVIDSFHEIISENVNGLLQKPKFL